MRGNDIRAGKILVCFVGFLWLVVASLVAQVVTGAIVGQVRDQSGAVVQGAHIVATNQDTGITHDTTSDSNGLYSFRELPTGIYFIEITDKGFRTIKQGYPGPSSAIKLSLWGATKGNEFINRTPVSRLFPRLPSGQRSVLTSRHF
jgi:hypothetical protein